VGKLLDDSELELFDSFTQEYTELTGTPIKLYSARRGGSVDPVWDEQSSKYGYDPLWGEGGQPVPPSQRTSPEKVDWAFGGPWEFLAFVEFEESDNLSVSIDESMVRDWDAVCWVPRKTLDDMESPYPKAGDVIEVSRWLDASEKQIWFDVIRSKRSGALADSQTYVQFRLELKKRSSFDPARKVDGAGSYDEGTGDCSL
jgi:hypothetical protein